MSDAAVVLSRMRVLYARGPELRYVGNLDMQLLWERTIRRAQLPVAFSQGFNPRPRFHMAAALPLGFTSRCELLDIWLTDYIETAVLHASIQNAAPPGLTVKEITNVALNLPALQTLVHTAEYLAILRETPPEFDLFSRVEDLRAATRLAREWRKKAYDLRPLIFEITIPQVLVNEYPRLEMRLSAREGATGRPEEVLAALGLDPTTARVERTQLFL